jgi:molybdate transport repressor ModE-like protein
MTSGSGIRDVDKRPTRPEAGAGGDGNRWFGVEFRHLGALAAIAREGSFRRAAESLGYVQSAISGQIAHLEKVVGTQLVERSSGSAGTTLTVAGRVLLSHVDEILAQFEAARIDVRALVDTDVAVRIGVLDGVSSRLTRILRTFSMRFPNTPVAIHESQRDELNFDRLAGGELDLMITELPMPEGPFQYTLLERDAYVLLAAVDSSLAMQGHPPDVGQLGSLQLLLAAPTRADDSLVLKLRESGIFQQPSLRPRSVAAVQAVVGAGLGVAVVPSLGVDRDDPLTMAIAAPGLLPERLIVLVRHSERSYSAPVRGFIEIVEETFNERCPGVGDTDD